MGENTKGVSIAEIKPILGGCGAFKEEGRKNSIKNIIFVFPNFRMK
jgi:hypothetical protein